MPKKGELVYHRKDGLWEARYVKETDAFGKIKYGSVYAHSYEEAKEKRQAVLSDIRPFQRLHAMHGKTLSEIVNEYLYISKNRIKPSTYQRYEGFKKNHLACIEKQPVISFTTASIHEFAINRLQAGLSPESVNSVLIFLHACFKYGHRQYALPIPEIVYLKTDKKEMRVLSLGEQKKLVEYLNRDMDIYKFGILMALYTGVRIGELCALKWEDIDENCIRIRRTVQRLSDHNGGTELYIGTPKTSASARGIPVPSFLKDLIERYRRLSVCEYVLGTEQIPIAEPRVLQLKFKRYLEEAGIEKANFHALRHSFATRCVECGFDVKTLSEVLGHANVQTTLNKYVHSSFQLKIDNMEKLRMIV